MFLSKRLLRRMIWRTSSSARRCSPPPLTSATSSAANRYHQIILKRSPKQTPKPTTCVCELELSKGPTLHKDLSIDVEGLFTHVAQSISHQVTRHTHTSYARVTLQNGTSSCTSLITSFHNPPAPPPSPPPPPPLLPRLTVKLVVRI